MRFEDHTDCIVCGGWRRCEFCPEQTPATPRSVLWDYWAAGIIAGRPHEDTRECELLERLAMPMLGHYKPADVKPFHHDQLERLLQYLELDDDVIAEVVSGARALCSYAETMP